MQFAQSRFGIGLDTQVVEGFLVGGIVSTQNPIIAARDCVGVPRVGSFYADDTLLQCQLIEPKPFKNSRTKMWVLATYRPRDIGIPIDAAVIEFRAVPKTVQRVYDLQGNVIKINYFVAANNVTYPTWTGQITDQIACGVLHAEWVEYEDPSARLLPLVNGLNDAPYKGGDIYTWWVSDLGIRKMQYTAGYRITVELTYDPEKWFQVIPYRDKFGIIPSGVDLAGARNADPGSHNGYAKGTLKPFVNFNDLQIPAVT